MSRALVVFRRQTEGWRPVGVFLGTMSMLQSRFAPEAGLGDWVRNIHEWAKPTSGTTWEDWIGWALGALSNGHDLMTAEVKPELTVGKLYSREVLGDDPPRDDLKGVPNVSTVEEVPNGLGPGFRV